MSALFTLLGRHLILILAIGIYQLNEQTQSCSFQAQKWSWHPWLFLDLGKNYDLACTRKLLWSRPLVLSMHGMDICAGPWFNLPGFPKVLSSNNQAGNKCIWCRVSVEGQCNSASFLFHVFTDTLNQHLISLFISLPVGMHSGPNVHVLPCYP